MSVKFQYTPSAYKAGKIYTPIPNVDVADFSIDRNSIATRVNENGLIEVMGANVPRIDYTDGGCPVLLAEPQAENLIEYSEDISSSNWEKIGITEVGSVLSPTNDTNAFKIVESGLSEDHRLQQLGISVTTSAQIYTISLFVKKSERSIIKIRDFVTNAYVNVDLDTNTFLTNNSVVGSPKIETGYINGFKRISFSFTANSTAQIRIYPCIQDDVSNYQGDGVSGLFVFGVELEAGSKATSYIPTNGATVVRLADTDIETGDISQYIDSTQGSFEVNWRRTLKSINSFTYLTISGDTLDDRVEVYFSNTNNISARIKVAGVQYVLVAGTNDNTFKTTRIEWGNGEMRSYLDNVLISTLTINNFNAGDLKKILLQNGADRDCQIKSIKIS